MPQTLDRPSTTGRPRRAAHDRPQDRRQNDLQGRRGRPAEAATRPPLRDPRFRCRIGDLLSRHGLVASRVAREIGLTPNVLTEAIRGHRSLAECGQVLLRDYLLRETGVEYGPGDFYAIDPGGCPAPPVDP